MSCYKDGGRAFHTRGPATMKLLSPKLVCVRMPRRNVYWPRPSVCLSVPCAPIANPPKTAQLGGIPYQSPKLHRGPCSSVDVRPWTDRQTDRQTHVTTIHFASSTTHAKCKKWWLWSHKVIANVTVLQTEIHYLAIKFIFISTTSLSCIVSDTYSEILVKICPRVRVLGWLGGLVVMTLDSRLDGPGRRD